VWEDYFVELVSELGLGEPSRLAGLLGGALLVAADERPTAEVGFAHPEAAASGRLARNVANFFTRGRPGRFLVYSTHPAFGAAFQETLRHAGHTVVQAMRPGALAQYDGVFVGGDQEVDPDRLAEYVEHGGRVYLAGGTGEIPGEATFWNPLLRRFGLRFGTAPAGLSAEVAAFEPSPLFDGIRRLRAQGPTPIALLPGDWPDTRILSTQEGVNWWALYASGTGPKP
jgi:hypothetical protein